MASSSSTTQVAQEQSPLCSYSQRQILKRRRYLTGSLGSSGFAEQEEGSHDSFEFSEIFGEADDSLDHSIIVQVAINSRVQHKGAKADECKEPPEEVDEEVKLLLGIMKEEAVLLSKTETSERRPRICFLPFGKSVDDASLPKICSIGPIYGGTTSTIDKLKRVAFYLCREKDEEMVREWINYLRNNKKKAAEYYPNDVALDDQNSFVIMLAVDAYFIFKNLFWHQKKVEDNSTWTSSELRYYESILHDFLLLPNQIPFFLLDELFVLIPSHRKPCNSTLFDLLLNFFRINDPSHTCINGQSYNHLLQFYHRGLKFELEEIQKSSRKTQPLFIKSCKFILRITSYLVCFPWFSFLSLHRFLYSYTEPTAVTCVELQDAGVKFNCNPGACSFLDIWIEDGTLHIPTWSLDGPLLSSIYSLLAFEKTNHRPSKRILTSYIKFVCDLVRSRDDYTLLGTQGIIQARDSEVGVQQLNQLKDVLARLDFVDDKWIVGLRKDLKTYMSEPQHRWRAKLLKDYFSSPWSIVGWFVGGALLLLTLLQTIYTMQTYYQSPW